MAHKNKFNPNGAPHAVRPNTQLDGSLPESCSNGASRNAEKVAPSGGCQAFFPALSAFLLSNQEGKL